MAWQSPYRGEETTPGWLSKSAGQWVSRGVMFLLGLGMAYVGIRGMIYLWDVYAANPSSWFHESQLRNRRSYFDWPRVLFWLADIGLTLLGGLTIAASLLPVGSMQSLVERFLLPPVTGDRSGDDQYGIIGLYRRLRGRWW